MEVRYLFSGGYSSCCSCARCMSWSLQATSCLFGLVGEIITLWRSWPSRLCAFSREVVHKYPGHSCLLYGRPAQI